MRTPTAPSRTRLDDLSTGELIARGESLLSARNYRDAIDVYKLLLKREPQAEAGWRESLAAAYLERARELAGKAMHREAAVLWENIPSLCGQSPQPELYVGWLLHSGQYAKAVRVYADHAAVLTGAGELETLRASANVRMLPDQRFAEDIGFARRQQGAYRAQQRWLDAHRRCEQCQQFFHRLPAAPEFVSARSSGFASKWSRRRAPQPAVAIPFDDREAALQAGGMQARRNRAESERLPSGAAQPAAQLLPAEARCRRGVEQPEIAEDQQRCGRGRQLPAPLAVLW